MSGQAVKARAKETRIRRAFPLQPITGILLKVVATSEPKIPVSKIAKSKPGKANMRTVKRART